MNNLMPHEVLRLEEAKEKAFACMFWGLTAMLHVTSMEAGMVSPLSGIDLAKPDYLKQLIPALMMAGINSGAFADAGVSDETLDAICADLNIPSVVDAWEADIQQACMQNRAIHAWERQNG